MRAYILLAASFACIVMPVLRSSHPHHPFHDLLHCRLDDTEQDGWVDADEEGQNDQRPQRDVFLQVHVGQVAILFPQLTEEHPLNRPEEIGCGD
ncbi:MAG: hypothetical protein OXFUSZZB_002787, partial [Candidatus Fervidibacter sp.]